MAERREHFPATAGAVEAVIGTFVVPASAAFRITDVRCTSKSGGPVTFRLRLGTLTGAEISRMVLNGVTTLQADFKTPFRIDGAPGGTTGQTVVVTVVADGATAPIDVSETLVGQQD